MKDHYHIHLIIANAMIIIYALNNSREFAVYFRRRQKINNKDSKNDSKYI